MSVLSRREIGAAAGNLMPMHAAGFHTLQAVPLVARLLGPGEGSRRGRPARGARGRPRVAPSLCQPGVQALSGPPLFTLAPGGMLGGILVWGAAAAFALRGRYVTCRLPRGVGRPVS